MAFNHTTSLLHAIFIFSYKLIFFSYTVKETFLWINEWRKINFNNLSSSERERKKISIKFIQISVGDSEATFEYCFNEPWEKCDNRLGFLRISISNDFEIRDQDRDSRLRSRYLEKSRNLKIFKSLIQKWHFL